MTQSFDYIVVGAGEPAACVRPPSRAAAGSRRRGSSAAKDREAIVSGLQTLRRIMQAPALAPDVEGEPGPRCASEDALLDFARRRGSTVYHPTPP